MKKILKRILLIIVLLLLLFTDVYAQEVITFRSDGFNVIRSDYPAYPTDSNGNYSSSGINYNDKLQLDTAGIDLSRSKPIFETNEIDVYDESGNKAGWVFLLNELSKSFTYKLDDGSEVEKTRSGNYDSYIWFVADNFKEANKVNGTVVPTKLKPFTYKVSYKDVVLLSDGSIADLDIIRTTTLSNYNSMSINGGLLYSLAIDSKTNNYLSKKITNSVFQYFNVSDGTRDPIRYITNNTDMKFVVSQNGVPVKEKLKLTINDLDTPGFTTDDFTDKRHYTTTSSYVYENTNESDSSWRYKTIKYPNQTYLYDRKLKDTVLNKETSGELGIQFQKKQVNNGNVSWVNYIPTFDELKQMNIDTDIIYRRENYSPNAIYSESVKINYGLVSDVYIPKDGFIYISKDGKLFSGLNATNSVNFPKLHDYNDSTYYERTSGLFAYVNTEEFNLTWQGINCGTIFDLGGNTLNSKVINAKKVDNGKKNIVDNVLNPNTVDNLSLYLLFICVSLIIIFFQKNSY